MEVRVPRVELWVIDTQIDSASSRQVAMAWARSWL